MMFRRTTSNTRLENESRNTPRVNDQEKKSLELELSSIETLLEAMNDQQLRSVSPFNTPQHMNRDARVLEERASRIRQILGDRMSS